MNEPSSPVETGLTEPQLRELTHSLPHLVWTCLAEGPCDYLSRQWVEYTGIPAADQLGYGWLMQLHPDDRERVKAEWASTVVGGVAFDIEFRIRRADGIYRWFRTRAIPIRGPDGQISKWYGSNSDVDDYKRAEEEVRTLNATLGQLVQERTAELDRRNEELEAVFAAMTDAVHVYGADMTVTRTNPAARAFHGFDPVGLAPELLGRRLHFRHVDGRPLVWDELPTPRAFRGETVTGARFFLCHDGRAEQTIEKSSAPVRVGGEIVGAVTVWHDITDAQRTEDALRESEARISAIVETVPMGVAVTRTRDSTLLFANQAFARIMGREPEQIVGQRAPDFYWDAADRDELLRQLRSRGALEGYEIRYKRSDGTPFWASVWAQPIRFAGEAALLGAVMDVSDHKRSLEAIAELNRALELRTQELEISNEDLQAFAYSVSHDLRAPLRAVEGFSQALVQDHRDRLDDDGRALLDRSAAAARRMGQLIDDLLALSRISRQGLRHEAVDLSAMAREIDAELRGTDASRRVETVVADGLTAVGDPGLLRVMLVNLLSNAWKFTSRVPAARIEFGVAERDGKPSFFVRDNGAGFEMAYATKLFAPFCRLHKVSDFPGNGIGLATVQRIVRRHGGTLSAEAELDKGATFFFTLSHQRDKP